MHAFAGSVVEQAALVWLEGGGYLLLGVSEKPPRDVVGTQALPDTVAAAEKLLHIGGHEWGRT